MFRINLHQNLLLKFHVLENDHYTEFWCNSLSTCLYLLWHTCYWALFRTAESFDVQYWICYLMIVCSMKLWSFFLNELFPLQISLATARWQASSEPGAHRARTPTRWAAEGNGHQSRQGEKERAGEIMILLSLDSWETSTCHFRWLWTVLVVSMLPYWIAGNHIWICC